MRESDQDDTMKKLEAIADSLQSRRLTASEADAEGAKVLQHLERRANEGVDRVMKANRARERRFVILSLLFLASFVAWRLLLMLR